MRQIISNQGLQKIFKQCLLVFSIFILSFSSSPAKAFDQEFFSGNDILFYNPDLTCSSSNSSEVSSITGTGAGVEATLVQANIQTPNLGDYAKSQRERFIGTVDKVKDHNPDFFTLNEIREDNLDYGDYKSFKRDYPGAKTIEDTGVRIAWNTKKWKKIVDGIEQIHEYEDTSSSRKDRYALWATFENVESGGIVSVISTHYTTRATFAPNHDRAKTQSQNIKELAVKLQSNGPVLIGGDFNFQLSDADKPYSPATILRTAGLDPVFKAGEGTAVDWIFHSSQLENTEKKVYPTDGSLSDHPVLVAKFAGSSEATANSGTSVTDSKGCVCTTSTSSDTLVGGSNQEKVFNYFVQKGLSDIQTAGIVGNMSVESGFDPENVQNGTADASKYGEKTKDPSPLSAGWGLIQWTPGSKIIKAMSDAGLSDRPVYELSTQLDLVWAHLQNKPAITKGSFSIPEFKKITNVEEAVRYFEDKIEAAGEPNYPDRYAAANLALDQFSGNLSTSPVDTIGSDAISDCGSVDYGAAAGNAVQTALNYAWPEYHSPNYLNLKPAYAKAISDAKAKGRYVGGGPNPGVDCGGFITRVMQDSGLDSEYGGGGNTEYQERHLVESGKYKKIENPTSADLTPGAIAISSDYGGDGGGHTYMFVGNQPGFETQIASASYSPSNTQWRAPMAGHEMVADPTYNWYILK